MFYWKYSINPWFNWINSIKNLEKIPHFVRLVVKIKCGFQGLMPSSHADFHSLLNLYSLKTPQFIPLKVGWQYKNAASRGSWSQFTASISETKNSFCFINWFINHTMYVINDDKKCLTNPHWFAGILKLLKRSSFWKGATALAKTSDDFSHDKAPKAIWQTDPNPTAHLCTTSHRSFSS